VAVVDRLLAAGANPRAAFNGEGNILFAAARSNNPELIERFVQDGCNLAARDGSGGTPLKTAVAYGATQSTAKLLALGLRDPAASKYAADSVSNGWHAAAQCAALLARYGQLPAGIYRSAHEDESGSWHMRFLADLDEKTPGEIQAFVAGGGSLDAYVGVGDTSLLPLQDAVERTDFEQVKTLLALGVPAEDPPGSDASRQGWNSPSTITPLMIAVHLKEPCKYEMLKLLLAHGARANAAPQGSSPSVLAIALNPPLTNSWGEASPASVRLLLDHGAIIESSAVKTYADLVAHDPKRVLLIEARLNPTEIRLLRGGKR
jgi:hypothetical protein